MSAFETQVKKDIAVVVTAGTKVSVDSEWVELLRWNDLPPGPTILEVEVSAELGTVRPSDIQTRWRRPNHDTTKRQTHPIGSIKSWSTVSSGLEYLTPDTDLPLIFEAWCKGADITVVKVVAKSYNPAQDVAERVQR